MVCIKLLTLFVKFIATYTLKMNYNITRQGMYLLSVINAISKENLRLVPKNEQIFFLMAPPFLQIVDFSDIMFPELVLLIEESCVRQLHRLYKNQLCLFPYQSVNSYIHKPAIIIKMYK